MRWQARIIARRSIGSALLLGFVFLVVGALVAPSGAYSGSIDDRLVVITANRGQWLVSKIFDSLAVVFGVGGMMLLTVDGGRTSGAWLNRAAGIAFGLGGVVGLVWTFLLVNAPGPLYDRDEPAPIVVLFISLIAFGLLAHGIHCLRNQHPRWLALLLTLVGAGVLVALAFILASGAGPESAFGLGSLMYLAILVVGIRLIARGSGRVTDRGN